METCVRGFSFMIPDRHEKPDTVDLQFIEGDELMRKWKSTRRERNKLQEEKIWAEFSKEQDIVSSICSDDKYQFLEHLSDTCIKDIMEVELERIKKEVAAEEQAKDALMALLQEPLNDSRSLQSNTDEESPGHTCVVSFADTCDSPVMDMLQIFNEEKDEGSDGEGMLNESYTSLPTVREKISESAENNDNRSNNTSSTEKSSGNVTNVIESSIYCAKVKDLRVKINSEILNMISTLDRRDVFSMSLEEMLRMIKRSSEFCGRFTRIYIYQLQRQMHDIKRHSINLPFAKHTQFQSQMIRIVSLHLNLLQSYQVFRKAAETSWCVRESVSALGALLGATRAACAHCAAVKQPRGLAGAADIYNDSILESCDKLEEFVNEYTLRCEEFLNSCENTVVKQQKSKKPKAKKKPVSSGHRGSPKPMLQVDAQLSMYSLDTIRINSKNGRNTKNRGANNNPKSSKNESGKEQKKSCRRPLMRDPSAGCPKPARVQAPQDNDISTLVETIDTCFSPRERSPFHVKKTNTPRSPHVGIINEPFKKVLVSPRSLRKNINKTSSPRPSTNTGPSAISDKSNHKRAERITKEFISKEFIPKALTPKELTPKSSQENSIEDNFTKEDTSQMNITTDTSRNTSAQTICSPMTPVSKIKCAIKIPSVNEKEIQRNNVGEEVKPSPGHSLLNSGKARPEGKREMERFEVSRGPDECEVSRLLKQLCSGDSNVPVDRTSGPRNVQLIHVNSSLTRGQPSTPQLLRILEETIQKKVPNPHYNKTMHHFDKHRLSFNISDEITENMFKYRTKFVQHMLTSPMYANSAVGKPWEMIGRVSEQIINEVIMKCVNDMQLNDVLREMLLQESD